MNIAYKTRNFYPYELRILKTLKTQKEKETSSKIKFYHYLIAGLLGASLTYVTAIIPDSFWTFLFGTIAVFAFAFIVFMPYEIYKKKNRYKLFLRQLSTTLEKGTVDTCVVKTKRIAIAPEYEDESDLYIIELNDNEVLYLWDTEYNLNKKFPCLDFEIYEDSFFKLIGRQIYPLSEKIQPVKIDKNAKWNFMKTYGASGHLETENINFDELLQKYNNCA
ncbi:hypothetical protein [Pedobacter glucosidilyticus]|uniref:hypothetical protein n=1 Tax=Pedobacter glucosidilyticus TaxID=1122941 RepID=UPI000421F0F9|nr:hypothetical protein [Pedobacter glucosidilyticus]